MRRWRDLVIPRRPGARQPAPGGLHAFTRERDGQPLRLHLRVERDGSGLLLAAASEAVRLSAAAAAAAHALLRGGSMTDAAGAAGSDRVAERVQLLLEDLGRPDHVYPVFNLQDPGLPGGEPLLAPFEADVVLTPGDDLDRVRRVLDRLWAASVPHVRFRVPDGPLDSIVPLAVERAEDVGLITGLRVARPDAEALVVVERAIDSGLDHVTVPWSALASDRERQAAARMLQRARELETCPVAEIPLVAGSLGFLDDALAALRERGVENAQVWAIVTEDETDEEALPVKAMRQAAAWTEERADLDDMRVTWVPPARRDPRRPLVEQLARGPRAGSDVSIRVETDATVLPPRGPSASGGNLLTEDWPTLWGRETFRHFRARVDRDTRCESCPGLLSCAPACPADPQGWSEA